MKEHQLKWLCNHLGHTGKVQETHYRATSGLIERVEIAKLLLIQENNMAGQFAGQDLSEIQFEGWLFSQEFTSRGLLFFLTLLHLQMDLPSFDFIQIQSLQNVLDLFCTQNENCFKIGGTSSVLVLLV